MWPHKPYRCHVSAIKEDGVAERGEVLGKTARMQQIFEVFAEENADGVRRSDKKEPEVGEDACCLRAVYHYRASDKEGTKETTTVASL